MSNKHKNIYLQSFGIIVLILALVRCAFVSDESMGKSESTALEEGIDSVARDSVAVTETNLIAGKSVDSDVNNANYSLLATRFVDEKGNLVKHKIYSVAKYTDAFPDSNDVQMRAARRWGVSPVRDREEAEQRKLDLVYIGSNPYFYVEKLHRSIPYLVPRASILLQDIGKNFFDSLQIKGVPLHKPIVTSVMRSQVDVEKLRNYNRNATENSCHLYGTTFDICYNRYKTVSPPGGDERRVVRNDTLKFILSEVLNDLRRDGRCYIKYEVKQGCFHITVR